jgi:hypothetical protein
MGFGRRRVRGVMTFDEACSLIVREGGGDAGGDGGLPVCVRVGDDPGAERMRRLVLALRVVFDGLAGREAVDRKLAGALYGLALYVVVPVGSGTRSRAWRAEFVDVEVVRLGAAVESIFEGVWVEWI